MEGLGPTTWKSVRRVRDTGRQMWRVKHPYEIGNTHSTQVGGRRGLEWFRVFLNNEENVESEKDPGMKKWSWISVNFVMKPQFKQLINYWQYTKKMQLREVRVENGINGSYVGS